MILIPAALPTRMVLWAATVPSLTRTAMWIRMALPIATISGLPPEHLMFFCLSLRSKDVEEQQATNIAERVLECRQMNSHVDLL